MTEEHWGEDAGFVWDGVELRGTHEGEDVMERGNPLKYQLGGPWRE